MGSRFVFHIFLWESSLAFGRVEIRDHQALRVPSLLRWPWGPGDLRPPSREFAPIPGFTAGCSHAVPLEVALCSPWRTLSPLFPSLVVSEANWLGTFIVLSGIVTGHVVPQRRLPLSSGLLPPQSQAWAIPRREWDCACSSVGGWSREVERQAEGAGLLVPKVTL